MKKSNSIKEKINKEVIKETKQLSHKKCNFKLWWLVGAILPPVGLILYILWRKNRKDDAKRVGTGALIAAIIWAFVGLSFIPTNYLEPNVLKEIDISNAGEEVSNWYKDLESGEAVVTVIASSTCPHCQALKPIISESSIKYDYKLYFFEADQLSDSDYSIVSDAIELEGYEGYVPFTFVVKNKEFKGSKTGEMDDDLLTEFLKQSQVLEG